MLFQSLRSALRNLLRHRQNALIIILSLTIAFAFSNLLLAFLLHELGTDSFHTKKDRIYRLLSSDPWGDESRLRYTLREAAQFIADRYPEVEAVCTISKLNNEGITTSESAQVFDEVQFIEADTTFFRLFDYPIVEGSLTDFHREAGVVLTETTARQLLGELPYTSRTIEIYEDTSVYQLPVIAVIARPKENTQFQFDGVVMRHRSDKHRGGASFLLVQPEANMAGLTDKVNSNGDTPSLVGPGQMTYFTEPFARSYFSSDDRSQPFEINRSSLLVKVCGVVIGLLLLSAGFNFITLLVVGLLHRKKEIGLRKTLGASRLGLGTTVGAEVGMFVTVSFILSVLLTAQLLPYFNTAFEATLTFSYFTQGKVLAVAGGIILLIGLLTTIGLGYYLWNLNTIKLLGEQIHPRLRMNRWLFTIQFLVATTLMVCSSVIIRQMDYIRTKPLGFNRNLLELRAPDKEGQSRLAALKNLLLQYPKISRVALSTSNPVSGNWLVRYELEDDKFYAPYQMSGDEDLIETLGLTVTQGKPFRSGDPSGKMVNETLVRHFSMKDPIGEKIPGTDDHIVGVVNDFNAVSLKEDIPLFIISYQDTLPRLLMDIATAPLGDLLPPVQAAWEKIYPHEPFAYQLIDDQLLAQHHDDTFFYRIIISFTIASILISCFGLYGVASFTSQQRTQEIGIRKVLGASVGSLLLLLSKDYIRWLLIALAVAIPVANYFMNEWLQSFAYRIDVTAWVLLSPGLLILLIALLTVSQQTLSAARRNPVDSLRDE